MVNGIKGNFKDKYRRRNTSITCPSCAPLLRENEPDGEPEKPPHTQNHLLEACIAFEEVRGSTDLRTDAGLVSFFNEVVRRRTLMEENRE